MYSFREFLIEQCVEHDSVNLYFLYDKFNKELFNYELPKKIKLSWSKALKRTTGIAVVKLRNKKEIVPNSYAIRLTKNKEFTLEEVYGILVHEMIHIWFYVQNDFEEQHGYKFTKKRKELQNKVNFNIPIKDEIPKKLTKFAKRNNAYAIIIDKLSSTHKSFALFNKKVNVNDLIDWSKHLIENYSSVKTIKVLYVYTNLGHMVPLQRVGKRAPKIYVLKKEYEDELMNNIMSVIYDGKK